MKSFYHYLAESTKSFKYRVKAVVPMDSHFVETLKKALFKYDVQSVSTPKKLMAQTAPMDFPSFKMAEVWILDIVTSIPASTYSLATELRSALSITDSQLIVRAENDPVELQAEKIEEILKDDEAEAKLNDGMYEKEDQPKEVAYGDAYNKKFLNYLAQIKADEDSKDIPAIEEVKKTNKFSWLNPKDRTVADDFNKDHDTVKPVHVNTKKAGAKAEKPNLNCLS